MPSLTHLLYVPLPIRNVISMHTPLVKCRYLTIGQKQSSNNPVIVTMETSSAQVFHAPAQSAPESPRLDVDEESSQPRFYGPTSQRHTHGRSVPRDLDLLKASTDGDTELNVDSGPVRRLLQQTFFKTQPLSQAIIDEVRIVSCAC